MGINIYATAFSLIASKVNKAPSYPTADSRELETSQIHSPVCWPVGSVKGPGQFSSEHWDLGDGGHLHFTCFLFFIFFLFLALWPLAHQQASCQLRFIPSPCQGEPGAPRPNREPGRMPGPARSLVQTEPRLPRLTTRCLGLARDTSISSAPELSLGEPDRKSIVSSSCLLSPSATVWMAVVHSSLRGQVRPQAQWGSATALTTTVCLTAWS